MLTNVFHQGPLLGCGAGGTEQPVGQRRGERDHRIGTEPERRYTNEERRHHGIGAEMAEPCPHRCPRRPPPAGSG